MKMPFERLMELAAALSDEDADLPMGKLAERWGEPVQRIADAIDAVRVMNGERTYISLDVPAPEPPRGCDGFRWIGQPFTSCDGCGRPAWEHKGMQVLKEGSSPFGGSAMEWEVRPWAPGHMERVKAELS